MASAYNPPLTAPRQLSFSNYYEVSGENITQYYYAGTQRVAMRNGTLNFMLSDQLGSTSVTTDSSGQNPTTLEYDPGAGHALPAKMETATIIRRPIIGIQDSVRSRALVCIFTRQGGMTLV